MNSSSVPIKSEEKKFEETVGIASFLVTSEKLAEMKANEAKEKDFLLQ
jgi:hypothetical protein